MVRPANDDELVAAGLYDIVLFCGLDAVASKIWAPIIRDAWATRDSKGNVQFHARTGSVHRYREHMGYYTRRGGKSIMAEKAPGTYADWIHDIYQTRSHLIMWCKNDADLICDVIRKLNDVYGLRARAYVMSSRMGMGECGRMYVDGAVHGRRW